MMVWQPAKIHRKVCYCTMFNQNSTIRAVCLSLVQVALEMQFGLQLVGSGGFCSCVDLV